MYHRKALPGERTEKCDAGCGVVPSALIVWKRAIPRNRMREILTSGSVGGLAEQSPILPGQPTCYPWRAFAGVRLGVRDSNLEPFQSTPPFSPYLGSILLNASRA